MSNHFLVVKRCTQHLPGDKDCTGDWRECDFETEIECQQVTDACRTWWECEEPACRSGENDEILWENSSAHGVDHQHLECGWATPSGDCWAVEFPERQEMIEDAFDSAKSPIVPGRFKVLVDADDSYGRLIIVGVSPAVTSRVRGELAAVGA